MDEKSALTAAAIFIAGIGSAPAIEAKIGLYSVNEVGSSSLEAQNCVAQYNRAVPALQAWQASVITFNNADDAMRSPADVPTVIPLMLDAHRQSKKVWSLLTDFDHDCGQQYFDVSRLMGLASREIVSIEGVMAKLGVK
jgi:hypothetical protein